MTSQCFSVDIEGMPIYVKAQALQGMLGCWHLCLQKCGLVLACVFTANIFWIIVMFCFL
ncbi:hypothetical protein CsSME_00011749 [Camellia sinensis var. sinensis]